MGPHFSVTSPSYDHHSSWRCYLKTPAALRNSNSGKSGSSHYKKKQAEGLLTEEPSTQESHHDHVTAFQYWNNHEDQAEHIMRGARSNGGNTCLSNDSWRENNCFMRKREEKLQKPHPESAFGWILIGWVLGRSLKCLSLFTGINSFQTDSSNLPCKKSKTRK